MGRDLDEFISQNFRNAIERHDIQAFYQPVVRTSTRQLCSFEALARWADPEVGMIYPNEFIPVLEREGLIHLLDFAILRQVCARIRSSIDRGETPIPVSVNLSRLDFSLCDVFTMADGIVSDYRIPHDFVYFEITESIMAEQKDFMMEVVDTFRAAGYQVWMDDFGSAYSSLNVLKDFTFDELKLDMSFLRPFNQRSRRIITAVVRMAKDIYIHTLAEGVETEEQFAFLRDIGCEKAQGYFFGKPLPYEEALTNLRDKKVPIELPQDRTFYDEIGTVNYLSSIPFMTQEERDEITTAKQLNSIPLMMSEFSADSFKVLFYNSAFEEMALKSGMFNGVFCEEMLGRPQPYLKISKRIIDFMESVRDLGEAKMLVTIHDQYFEMSARCVTQAKDKYCVLVRVTNLTKETQADKTGQLDEHARQIYAMYDRITLLNYREDSVTPLYTDAKVDLIAGRQGIRELTEGYVENYIFPEDKARFLSVFDPEVVTTRLAEGASTSFSEVLRTSSHHGQYAWTEYTMLQVDAENYFLLVRNIHDIAKSFIESNAVQASASGPYAPEQLWNNVMNSELLYIFWKDKDRRFLGASKGFLDYYEFSSVQDILGKNDEEMGWHVHPDLYMNDEYRVIHEGLTFHNMPGNCMSHGENREILASKTPLYDVNGEITGLLGYFIDKGSLGIHDVRGEGAARRELVTGMLNYRGLAEESEAFHDEYYLRGTDFVRIHIGINDFNTINEQYGYDFGDKVLDAFGHALMRGFGLTSSVARYAGRKFTVLKQVRDREEAHELHDKVKEIGRSIREVDGRPVTLYLSVGYALYSEYLDLDKQARAAEMRLHADFDQDITDDDRAQHASELFSLFDDLPLPYAVYHVTKTELSGHYEATFFYVNHMFEEAVGLPAKEIAGHTVRELFPFLGDDWHREIKRAALDGDAVEGTFNDPTTGLSFHFTACQILFPSYCAITFVGMPAAG